MWIQISVSLNSTSPQLVRKDMKRKYQVSDVSVIQHFKIAVNISFSLGIAFLSRPYQLSWHKIYQFVITVQTFYDLQHSSCSLRGLAAVQPNLCVSKFRITNRNHPQVRKRAAIRSYETSSKLHGIIIFTNIKISNFLQKKKRL